MRFYHYVPPAECDTPDEVDAYFDAIQAELDERPTLADECDPWEARR